MQHEPASGNQREWIRRSSTAAFEKTFGGSDNNVFAQHGIEGLVIATSMNQVHSCAEYTKIPEIAQVARIVANLAALQED